MSERLEMSGSRLRYEAIELGDGRWRPATAGAFVRVHNRIGEEQSAEHWAEVSCRAVLHSAPTIFEIIQSRPKRKD